MNNGGSMKHFFAVLALLTLFGCDQIPGLNKYYTDYQITVEKDRIVRFNASTGEIMIIQKNGQIKKYDNDFFKRETQLLNPELISKRKTFPGSKEMLGRLSYKWKKNKIHFDYEFGPYSQELDEAMDRYDSFTLIFHDLENFPVIKTKVSLKEAIRTVGSDNKPVYWSFSGQVHCKMSDYNDIGGYTYQWSYTDKFDKAIENFDMKLKAEKEKKEATKAQKVEQKA